MFVWMNAQISRTTESTCFFFGLDIPFIQKDYAKAKAVLYTTLFRLLSPLEQAGEVKASNGLLPQERLRQKFWFKFPLEGMTFLIFSFHRPGNKTKRGAEFSHSTKNSSRIRWKEVNVVP